MHEADNVYSIRSTWLRYRMVRFLTVTYSGKHCILDLSLIDLLLIFFPSGCVILIQRFLWVLSQTITLLASYEMFSSFFGVILSIGSLFTIFFVVEGKAKPDEIDMLWVSTSFNDTGT